MVVHILKQYRHLIQQGIADDDGKYLLTDPAIHCKQMRFGTTDLGPMGMETFFEAHECSATCQMMGLRPNRFMKKKEINPALSTVSASVLRSAR